MRMTTDQMLDAIAGNVQLYRYEDGSYHCNHDDIPISHELETKCFETAEEAVAAVWLFLNEK